MGLNSVVYPCFFAFTQFVHSVIDSIGGREGPKYATFSKSLSLEQFCKLKTALVAFVKLCVHEKHEPSKVRATQSFVVSDHC